MPELSSASRPARAEPVEASALARGVPVEKSATGIRKTARIASAIAPTTQRRRTTRRPQGTQPWPVFVVRRPKPTRSSLGPMESSTTGRSVIPTSTLTRGMSMPP